MLDKNQQSEGERKKEMKRDLLDWLATSSPSSSSSGNSRNEAQRNGTAFHKCVEVYHDSKRLPADPTHYEWLIKLLKYIDSQGYELWLSEFRMSDGEKVGICDLIVKHKTKDECAIVELKTGYDDMFIEMNKGFGPKPSFSKIQKIQMAQHEHKRQVSLYFHLWLNLHEAKGMPRCNGCYIYYASCAKTVFFPRNVVLHHNPVYLSVFKPDAIANGHSQEEMIGRMLKAQRAEEKGKTKVKEEPVEEDDDDNEVNIFVEGKQVLSSFKDLKPKVSHGRRYATHD